MSGVTAVERALARASVYRVLGLAFAYPTPEVFSELTAAMPVAAVGAPLVDEPTAAAVAAVAAALEQVDRDRLESSYQTTFTLTYNEDCPLYETAFSSSHIFQQTQEQADIAGFYEAFGVRTDGERPDHLALELEYLYLLTLKEATAREKGETEHIRVCREAQRSFIRDHLGRWAPLIGKRIAVAGAGGFYAAAAELLLALSVREEKYLRLGTVAHFRDEPVLIADEPGEMSCPAFDYPSPAREKDTHLAIAHPS